MKNCDVAGGKPTTAVTSNESVPSAEADEAALDPELVVDNTKERRLNDLWMDFDVLCKCFRFQNRSVFQSPVFCRIQGAS